MLYIERYDSSNARNKTLNTSCDLAMRNHHQSINLSCWMAIRKTTNIHVIMNCTEPHRFHSPVLTNKVTELVVDLAKVESPDDVDVLPVARPQGKLVSCPKGVVERKERNRSTSKLNRMMI